jgi:hypothetical protein
MTQITTSGDLPFRHRLVFALLLAFSSWLGLGLADRGQAQARAATVASSPNPGSVVLGRPFALDQYGQPIVPSAAVGSHAVVLAAGSVPNYLAYRLPKGASVPSGIPTIDAGSSGKFQFTSLVQSQVSQELAKNGEAAVTNGRHTFLVEPLPMVLGATGGTAAPHGISHAWRATLSTRHSDPASKLTAGSHTNTTTSTTASKTPSTAPTTVQAQTIVPTTIVGPLTSPKLANDMVHLLTIKSGKFVNWNPQTFGTLKSDMSLSSPKNVAPQLSTMTTTTTTTKKPTYQAQVIAGLATSPTTAQPIPAPEPGTLAIFSLVAVALVYRLRRRQ